MVDPAEIPDRDFAAYLRRRQLWWTGGTVLLLLAVAAFVCRDQIRLLARGERDLLGQYRYVPAYPVDPAVADQIDFERLYAELIPAWMIAVGHPTDPDAAAKITDRAQAVRQAVAADPNLSSLFDELERLALAPRENGERLVYLAWAWNRQVDLLGVPWRLGANVLIGADQAYFYTESYRVVGDARVLVGSESVRTRILSRVDSTNIVESFLGRVADHRDGAFVVLERLEEFVLDEIWPLLDADALVGRELVGGPLIQRELFYELRLPDLVALIHSAPWRRQLLAALDIDADCPPVTPVEVRAIAEAARHLRATKGLEDALAALLAHAARGFAVHEARHAADEGRLFAYQKMRLRCGQLCRGWDRVGLAELSAILASLAHSPARYLALYQMCGMEIDNCPRRAGVLIADALPGGCDDPDENLALDAAGLEELWLGRSEPIAVPEEFPRVLPVTTREH